ncbi:MAG: tRNA 4-thiouridine(8) synthase ThiI [Clostridia bacterium]|nr:tRNA 4-thiouridine(8) synthase ThiI [Clostridia bacterium]
MRSDILLLKYGEVVMKGLNRSYFDNLIVRRVKNLLKTVEGEFTLEYAQSTLCILGNEDADMEDAAEKMKRVFGVASVCRAFRCEKSVESIRETVKEHIEELVGDAKTFKCEGKRSDKSFPLSSPALSAEIGGTVLQLMPHLTVDVNRPDVVIKLEVRDKYAAVHGGGEKGAGGMPNGSAGHGMLLLSGGIDSPVAGYLMAKRGLTLDALYFDSPPYTSEAAAEKVQSLAGALAAYCGRIFMHTISLTEIQETLMSACDERLFTILLRRFMMRLAEKQALDVGAAALITGESLGQVASQTLNALSVTNAVPEIPVFRPCIAMDKDEIVQISRKIGTFDISILPYEDCCTVFVPRHPNTRPTMEQILEEEAKLDIEGLVERAFATRRHKKITEG